MDASNKDDATHSDDRWDRLMGEGLMPLIFGLGLRVIVSFITESTGTAVVCHPALEFVTEDGIDRVSNIKAGAGYKMLY